MFAGHIGAGMLIARAEPRMNVGGFTTLGRRDGGEFVADDHRRLRAVWVARAGHAVA